MIYARADIEKRELTSLAPYAVKSCESAGRVFEEPQSEYRSCFQRDRDRVIHSKAFRRLMEKTQVFVANEGDHYRNRMSHSVECSQVSKGLARSLGLNEDLAETIALAHDLGHTPFGHAGEAAMDACMKKFGSREPASLRSAVLFEHNEQSLRVVEILEKMYPEFDGLNLSKEVLDGLLKHRTPFDRPKMVFRQSAHLEAQVVDLGDEIAYMSHDLDDGLRAKMFLVEDVVALPVVARAYAVMTERYGEHISPEVLRLRLSSSLMHLLIDDVIVQTEKNLMNHHIVTLEDVRSYDGVLVLFSPMMRSDIHLLREFLSTHYYYSPRIKEQCEKGQMIIQKLFNYFLEHPEKLPENFQRFLSSSKNASSEPLPIVVKDYIAGMTDGFAEREAQKYGLI